MTKSGEQQRAEIDVEGFRQKLGPFVAAAEKTRMPMVFTDAKIPGKSIIFANDSFLLLTGYRREEVLGQPLCLLIVPSGNPESISRIERAFSGNADGQEIHCHRKDGNEFWTTIFVSPVSDATGEIRQYFTSFHDISAHRLEQARARAMIAELNHRVKNSLATMRSVVDQAFRNCPDMASAQEAIEARLFALSRTHDLLTVENWGTARLGDVVRVSLEPFGIASGRAERFSISGGDVRFPPNSALALSVAFHELASNAVKYGALSNELGTVTIAWSTVASPTGDRLNLRWEEKEGPLVKPPSRKGFGSRVIERGLAHELDGIVHIEYPAGGVVCTVDVPVPKAGE